MPANAPLHTSTKRSFTYLYDNTNQRFKVELTILANNRKGFLGNFPQLLTAFNKMPGNPETKEGRAVGVQPRVMVSLPEIWAQAG